MVDTVALVEAVALASAALGVGQAGALAAISQACLTGDLPAYGWVESHWQASAALAARGTKGERLKRKDWREAEIDVTGGTVRGDRGAIVGVRIDVGALDWWLRQHAPRYVGRPAAPAPNRPTQEAVDAWMTEHFRRAKVAGRAPPKRDGDAFPACRRAIGATDPQMRQAMKVIPAELKRHRGDRDRSANRVANQVTSPAIR